MNSFLSKKLVNQLDKKYPRENRNLNFAKVQNTTIIGVGAGAFSFALEDFARMGIGRIYVFEIDFVEAKNMISQNFIFDDISKQKDQAIKQRLEACSFEKNNPEYPKLQIHLMGDFLAIKDDELYKIIEKEKKEGRFVILIEATDYHPAQARGNRIAIKFKIPVLWVGIYRMGKAGEIIFYIHDHNLPCYRCITESRYIFFDKNRLTRHLTNDHSGSGQSMGLPAAATFIDSILIHLVIGLIHLDCEENQHGKLFKRLLNEGRNLIQCLLDPTYKLNDNEDIFADIKTPDTICFNTQFLAEKQNTDCIDCRSFNTQYAWENTDYTKENYRRTIETFSDLTYRHSNGRPYSHPLSTEYAAFFNDWEQIQRQTPIHIPLDFINVEIDYKRIDSLLLSFGSFCKSYSNIQPCNIRFTNNDNLTIWEGRLENKDLIWPIAFPDKPLSLAADTRESEPVITRRIHLLENKICVRIIPGLECGQIEIEIY